MFKNYWLDSQAVSDLNYEAIGGELDSRDGQILNLHDEDEFFYHKSGSS